MSERWERKALELMRLHTGRKLVAWDVHGIFAMCYWEQIERERLVRVLAGQRDLLERRRDARPQVGRGAG